MITRNFLKASFIYTLAGALPMASATILLPLYMRFLPKDVYGALSLYLAFTIFVQILVSFSFESSTYLHYHEFKHDSKKLSSFISSAFIFILITGVVVGLFLVVLGEVVFKIIFHDPRISFYPYGLMSVVTGIFQSIFKVYSNILQSRERPILFLRSNVLQLVLVTVLTVLGLYFFPATLVGPIGGRMLAGAVVAGWSLYRVFKEFGVHYDFPLLRSTFGFNIYTFIHQLQQWVINYFDRFVMIFFISLATVGIYDIAIKCLIAIEFITNGMYNSFYPKVVSTITAQTEKTTTPILNRYYNGLMAIVMICVSVGIFLVPFVIEFLDAKKEYTQALQYLPYIAVTFIFKGMRFYFAAPYGILKYTKPLPVLSFITAVLKIGTMVMLIKPFGIYGVVAATLISAAIEIFMLRAVLRNRFRFHFNIFKLVVAPVALGTFILLMEPLVGEKFAWQLHGVYVLATAALLLWVYRNELHHLRLSKILSK